MKRRIYRFSTFTRHFLHHMLVVREVVLGLVATLVLGGVAISAVEERPLGESLYFAFITGLSIGFGDIVPQTSWGRVISVAIGLVGMIFVGLTVAIATRALADTVTELRKNKD